jgi:hypothetical protein
LRAQRLRTCAWRRPEAIPRLIISNGRSRLEGGRSGPQNAGIDTVGIDCQHLVIEFSGRCRGLGDAIEVSYVLPGLLDDVGLVGPAGVASTCAWIGVMSGSTRTAKLLCRSHLIRCVTESTLSLRSIMQPTRLLVVQRTRLEEMNCSVTQCSMSGGAYL